MKKIANLREFREYCENNKPKRIVFHTEDQSWHCNSDTYKLEMSFKFILISENPNLICLKSENSTMLINRVKYIEIDTSMASFGTVYRVYSEDNTHKKKDIVYNLLST